MENELISTRALARAYGVKLQKCDLEELGEECPRKEFKMFFEIPEDADENPDYKRHS